MPVQINYKGRLGNKIFQYVSARIFSEKNGLNLITDLTNDVVKITDPIQFSEPTKQNREVKINSKSFINNEINFEGYGINYVFDDFFQNGDYINNNEKLVKTFFDLPNIKKKNYDDIVIHLRLDDYLHVNNISNPETWEKSEIVSPKYYTDILERETYNKIYLVVDKINYEWEKKYIDKFQKFNPIIISNTAMEDFEFIRGFDKIITSNSTFCYWSAFLSDATTIYTFGNIGKYGKDLISHGDHVQNINNIKNKSISIKEEFYYGVD